MNFRISGLPILEFVSLLTLGDDALRDVGVTSCIADAPGQYPCRITLEDAWPGESLLLLNYTHLAGPSPYRSSGPIFIRRTAVATCARINEVPDQQRRRLLSVRAYDANDWMVDADVTPGTGLEALIYRYFAEPAVQYLHVHNARRGCYACRVDREPTPQSLRG